MGEVVWLGRYPVKSMLGEDLTSTDLDSTGLAGDRRFALVDRETGLVASAKNPRKWRRLLTMHAALGVSGHVTVTLPGGETVRDDDPHLDERLSDAVGRPVTFARSRPDDARIERLTPAVEAMAGTMTTGSLATSTFVDFAPVHVVTTATLDALDHADPRRFRPNIIVRMLDGAPPFAENAWQRLTLGPAATLRVMAPTPRCAIPTLAQGDLPENATVLRTAARLNRVQVLTIGKLTCVGGYAAVDHPGRVQVGDRVLVA